MRKYKTWALGAGVFLLPLCIGAGTADAQNSVGIGNTPGMLPAGSLTTHPGNAASVPIVATTSSALTLLSADVNFVTVASDGVTLTSTPTNAPCFMIKQPQVNPDALQRDGRAAVAPQQGGAVCGTCTYPVPPGTACSSDTACTAAAGACSGGTCTFPPRACASDSDCGGGSCVSGSCIFFAPRCTVNSDCGQSGTCGAGGVCNPQPPTCTTDTQCSGTCNLDGKILLAMSALSASHCVGGTNAGNGCSTNSDCPSGLCAADQQALLLCSNLPQTTLSAAIGTGDTSIPLVSATGFPSSGTVFIESELINYTGISGNTLTGASRGASNTSAATHAGGTPVTAQISCDSNADCPVGMTPCNAPIPSGTGNIAKWNFTVNTNDVRGGTVKGGIFGLSVVVTESKKGPLSVPLSPINGLLRIITCVGDADFNGVVTSSEAVRCVNAFRRSNATINPPADSDGNGVVTSSEAVRCINNFRRGQCGP